MDLSCYRCHQPGHYSASCPTRESEAHPAAPPQQAAEPLKREKHLVTVECDICGRDWAAVAFDAEPLLMTLNCPWCQQFEITPEGPRRRAAAL